MSSFLEEPAPTDEVQALYDADLADPGYVMNLTRVWAQQPACKVAFNEIQALVAAGGDLSMRERGILVSATASARGDSYCSYAWGQRLANASEPATAAAVLRGTDEGLEPHEQALAVWARRVVRDPNTTTAADVQALRDAGYDDGKIMAVTLFVGLRLAFSSINAALGAAPDRELEERVSSEVIGAVDYGRPVAD
jgi:uncharacterized peroxidase-related enzyme